MQIDVQVLNSLRSLEYETERLQARALRASDVQEQLDEVNKEIESLSPRLENSPLEHRLKAVVERVARASRMIDEPQGDRQRKSPRCRDERL